MHHYGKLKNVSSVQKCSMQCNFVDSILFFVFFSVVLKTTAFGINMQLYVKFHDTQHPMSMILKKILKIKNAEELIQTILIAFRIYIKFIVYL